MSYHLVQIYADGACRGNPGPGGWGAILVMGEHEKAICGGALQTTNNQMELTAVIEALKALKKTCSVDLYTDSKYVCEGLKQWLPNWKRNSWRTAGKKPVKNMELWQALDTLAMSHVLRVHWVKGHSGHPGNERADALANQGLDAFLAQQETIEGV
jgi:ribonuclease HI